MGDNYPVDATELRESGTKGIMSVGAGIGLFGVNAIIGALTHIPWVGPVIGGGLLVFGLVGLLGKSKTDKVAAGVLVGAGVAVVMHGFVSFLLGLGGLGLLAYGGWNIVKFVRGLKRRA